MPERAGKPYDFFVAPPDIHEPYSDPKALGAVERFIRHTRPSLVVLLGDNVDFYQLSRFDQDPKRALALQEDCDKTFEAMRRFRKAAPSARIHYLQGNHEDRLRRYLWGKSVALSSLKCLTVPELLRLKELDIRYHESGQFRVKDLLFKHGNVVRKKSGFTAMAELERNWLSGVSGHTHRLSEVYRRNKSGYYKWVEGGCLCDLNPEYARGEDFDWQHGLTWGWIERGGNRFSINTAPIVNGRIVYGGREIAA